ncbi:thiamine pyrophosphokinase [Pedobacter puniceum]|uniref:Thiamine pyrophosphokinase n=1 Tax=Pedobacter puniceum TaxID=2666136 RepID=A0A7K0FNL5_9SPHI|nr:thiamine pyrophosphokinase [Pedobacter puniceum]MRX47578.1 thiamine pyrophosphokinase [Pedobacter puniceum]
MSSHHIIREKQEPALFILNMSGFDEEYLGQLLEWSPTVIVHAAIYDHVVSLGIKIDVVVSKEDVSFALQEHIKIIPCGDDDVTTAVLKYLVAHEYPSVNIITNTFLAKDYLFFVDYLDLVVFADSKKMFPVKPEFSKWKPAQENIYILQEAVQLSTKGLNLISNNHYQTEKDGFYSLSFQQPFIFIAEDL